MKKTLIIFLFGFMSLGAVLLTLSCVSQNPATPNFKSPLQTIVAINPTLTFTSTNTPTPTPCLDVNGTPCTSTVTSTPTGTLTPSQTPTPTNSPSDTPSDTPTVTVTPTFTCDILVTPLCGNQ